jgi:archaemetzincin
MDDYFFAFDPLRSQFLSTAILQELARAAPPDAIRVLAIVEVDLFIPILTHVYGEAQLGGKACIVSTYRLKDGLGPTAGHSAIEERSVKEALHELGHTFNLRHCKNKACIMHYCHTVRDVDRKENQLCRYCRILLEDELKRLERLFPPADAAHMKSVLKDERRTSNIERPTSNEKTNIQNRTFSRQTTEDR